LSFPAFDLIILAFAVALLGALGGLWMAALPKSARAVIPFSGGLLIGVAFFGLLPELAVEIGWLQGPLVFAAGYLILFLVDRNLHAICPSCSHDHNHNDCSRSLHGFTGPLLIAAAIHAFLDGWGLSSAAWGNSAAVRLAFPVAVMLHKIPEGLALGAIFRAAAKSRAAAFGWCFLAESATLAGGWAGVSLTPRLGSAWTNYPLAIAGGCFLYLGYHAVDAEWRRFGRRPAFVPALTGFTGAAMVQSAVRWFGMFS
jgi:zinc transporter ZupT